MAREREAVTVKREKEGERQRFTFVFREIEGVRETCRQRKKNIQSVRRRKKQKEDKDKPSH